MSLENPSSSEDLPLPPPVDLDPASIPSQDEKPVVPEYTIVADIPKQESSQDQSAGLVLPPAAIPNQASKDEGLEGEAPPTDAIPPQKHAARSPYSYCYSPTGLVENFKELKLEQDSSISSEDISSLPTGHYTVDSSIAEGSFVVAAIQLTAGGLATNDLSGFWKRAQDGVQLAAEKGANLVLLPELFTCPYFCQTQEACLMEMSFEAEDCFILKRMQFLAKKHCVVLPISFYERSGNALYNSVVMIDADGSILGKYRKSHIPDGPGYSEKFYFTPGDSGFQVWKTRYGTVGVGICWDQWFPEAARAMALKGADIILYPTAIGTEPQDPTIDSADHWQRVMQGHAAANMVPIVASNRFGTEILLRKDGSQEQQITFYGRSFITNETGEIVAEAGLDRQPPAITILTATYSPSKNLSTRLAWGLFRDRRPELYDVLRSKDGK